MNIRHALALAGLTALIATAPASAYPPPEKDEMRVDELNSQIFDLDGKVVELTANDFESFRQIGKGEYSTYCSCYKGFNHLGGVSVHFSGEEAKKFFKELVEKDMDSNKEVYVFVENKKITAIGHRFKKSKGIYSW